MPFDSLLHIDGLCVQLDSTPLLREVSLRVAAGEMLGLVGESGCGKSVTALSIMRLVAEPPMRTTAGHIYYAGRDLLALNEPDLVATRGRDIGMIFQEPMTSLNPAFRVGSQIAEALLLHTDIARREADRQAVDLLASVGIPAPESALRRYPHQLSGGQRQRVMIAIALACRPKLLIADEPTTALDVTVQAQILELLDTLRREHGLAVLLITHDLGVVRQYCDRVAVMYCGEIVEEGSADVVFATPRHRYTRALMDTIPAANTPGCRLPAIPGSVPPPASRPPACAFEPRCTASLERCAIEPPALGQEPHRVRCWNPVP